MVRVGIYGATGYAGQELVRILLRHEKFAITHLTSQQYIGRSFPEVFPNFIMEELPVLEGIDNQKILSDIDVVFLALPHGHAFEVAKVAKEYGVRVIDLGADFRLQDVHTYEQWYGLKHEATEILPEAVYGLPEINRARISDAWLVANPGCYPTASTLALLPLVEQGLVNLRSIVIDAKSGVSGAGRAAKTDNLYTEVNEGIKPYAVTTHRHTPEIEQNFTLAGGRNIQEPALIQFTPHLMPMTRGILSTVYADLQKDISVEEVRALYTERYSKEPFVKLLPEGIWSATKMVYGSNYCFVNVTVDKRTKKVIATAVIDNLIKGAAGQAVQNLNIMYGYPEKEGIDQLPIWP